MDLYINVNKAYIITPYLIDSSTNELEWTVTCMADLADLTFIGFPFDMT